MLARELCVYGALCGFDAKLSRNARRAQPDFAQSASLP